MATRRGRSMNREEDRLAEVLDRLANRPMMQAPQFKAPQYTGQEDIEYFISGFEEIAEANEWRPAATLLHLSDSLKNVAVQPPYKQCTQLSEPGLGYHIEKRGLA